MNSLHHGVGRSLAVHFGRRDRGDPKARHVVQPGVSPTKAKRAAKKAAQESLSKRFSQPRGLEGVSAIELFDATDGGIRKLDGLIRRMRGLSMAEAHKEKAALEESKRALRQKLGGAMSDVAKDSAKAEKASDEKATQKKQSETKSPSRGFVDRLASVAQKENLKAVDGEQSAAMTGENAQADAVQVRKHLLHDADGVAQRAHRTYVDTRASLAFA